MIRRFSSKNFRNVCINGLEFNKINILIGPNNSGKTNFIRALSFFANMMSIPKDSVGSVFMEEVGRNGWQKMLNKDADNREIALEWEIQLDENKSVDYRFSFQVGPNRQDFFITLESLDDLQKPSYKKEPFNYFRCHTEHSGQGMFSTASKKGQSNKRIPITISAQETVLMQFKDKLFENPKLYKDDTLRKDITLILEEMQSYFRKFFSYSSAQFNLTAMRQPNDIKERGDLLLKDGSNFVNVFNYYKTEDIYFKNIFEQKLRKLIPTLDATDIAMEFNKFAFRMAYNGKQYDLSDMSDGTLKAMLLTMLIHLPVNNGFSLLAIDEPEMNLHPAWQKTIGKWIQLSNNFRQCFISTHSPDFLDEFTEGFKQGLVGVFVFDPSNEKLIKKLEYDKIKEDLDNWELGDLYRVNDPALGGWPW